MAVQLATGGQEQLEDLHPNGPHGGRLPHGPHGAQGHQLLSRIKPQSSIYRSECQVFFE